jgi:hypothetical protein
MLNFFVLCFSLFFFVLYSLTKLGLGACSGLVMYTGAQWAKKFGYFPKTTLNRNHGMMMVLGGFALCTFLAASKTGKEEVHVLHPLFRRGGVGATDQEAANQHQKLDYEGRRQALMENRMTRRKTLDNLLHKHHGLSDSHAGRWVDDETKFEKK